MMVTHEELQRSLGRVEGNQDAMERRMDRFEKLVSDGFNKVEESLEAINSRLAKIDARENERKGAWGIIVALCAAASGLVTFLVSKLFVGG